MLTATLQLHCQDTVFFPHGLNLTFELHNSIIDDSSKLRFSTIEKIYGGRNRARTYDPLLVRQVLSQLSYAPIVWHSQGDSNPCRQVENLMS